MLVAVAAAAAVWELAACTPPREASESIAAAWLPGVGEAGAVAGAGAVAAAWLPGVGEVPSAGARRAVGSMGGASGVAPCVVAA